MKNEKSCSQFTFFKRPMAFGKVDEFFLIGTVVGGVRLGPLCTAATNRPTVPAPGDYDDGEIGGMIGRGN
jgi:hypothetical protein